MNRLMPAVVFLMLVCSVATAQTKGILEPSEIGNVLYCLNTKLQSIGYPPPHFDENSFRVRYVFGVVDKSEDKNNELHLVVYAKDENRAILYQVYLDQGAQPSIYIGEVGTLKQENRVMEPDEIWGGVGTYHYVKRLVRAVSAQPAITVPNSDVIASSRMCIFQR